MNELISVIVPVYNVEQYLNKCIENIISQTYSNIEIFLVDDGSTDSSGIICDKFLSIDKRIKVIHKNNGGLSDARNVALDVINGAYVTFIDSDDFVDENYIEYLYNLAKKYDADISICSYKVVSEKSIIKIKDGKYIETLMTQKEAIFELLSSKKFSNSAWAKLYKTSLFKDVRYPVGKIFEDVATTYKLFFKSKIIAYGNKPLYNYLIRNGSILRQGKFDKRRIDGVIFCEEMVDAVLNRYKDLEDIGSCRKFDSYVSILPLINRQEYKDLFDAIWVKILKIRGPVIKYRKAGLKRKVYALMTYFGNSLFVKFIRFIRK